MLYNNDEVYIYKRVIIKMWIEIGLLILAVPVGLLIAWLAKEELRVGRKWFWAICGISAVLTVLFLVLKIDYLVWTFLFVLVCTGMSLVKFK